MMQYSLKNRYVFLFLGILLLIMILCPVLCLADAEKIFKENNKAVVIVIAYDDAKKVISQGSGFVVGQDGAIVTSYHVISNARSIRIKAGAKVLNVDGIMSLDKENDIAILKAGAKNLPTVKLGNFTTTGIGEKVYVISSPQGLENTITDGILSGKREIAPNKIILQITAPISPGSSGGPVFNKNGEVIGVATFLLKNTQNLNFAIPVEVFKNKIEGQKVVTIKKSQIEKYENTLEYWVNRGVAYIESGKPKEALDAFTNAIELNPGYAYAYFNRGSVYDDLGNYQQAIKDYSKAIQFKPNDAEFYNNRGNAYNHLGNYQQAIKDYTKAIQLKPNDAAQYYNRGLSYGKLGNNQQAINDFKIAARLGDKHAQSLLIKLEIEW